jgi:hypothetical protein
MNLRYAVSSDLVQFELPVNRANAGLRPRGCLGTVPAGRPAWRGVHPGRVEWVRSRQHWLGDTGSTWRHATDASGPNGLELAWDLLNSRRHRLKAVRVCHLVLVTVTWKMLVLGIPGVAQAPRLEAAQVQSGGALLSQAKKRKGCVYNTEPKIKKVKTCQLISPPSKMSISVLRIDISICVYLLYAAHRNCLLRTLTTWVSIRCGEASACRGKQAPLERPRKKTCSTLSTPNTRQIPSQIAPCVRYLVGPDPIDTQERRNKSAWHHHVCCQPRTAPGDEISAPPLDPALGCASLRSQARRRLPFFFFFLSCCHTHRPQQLFHHVRPSVRRRALALEWRRL